MISIFMLSLLTELYALCASMKRGEGDESEQTKCHFAGAEYSNKCENKSHLQIVSTTFYLYVLQFISQKVISNRFSESKGGENPFENFTYLSITAKWSISFKDNKSFAQNPFVRFLLHEVSVMSMFQVLACLLLCEGNVFLFCIKFAGAVKFYRVSYGN